MNKKYLLGLDLGTNSVGWCLTDQNYDVVKKQGKSLKGVRLFEDAQDCSSRRMARTQSRRIKRRKERILLLQSLFNGAMCEIDANFFQRL